MQKETSEKRPREMDGEVIGFDKLLKDRQEWQEKYEQEVKKNNKLEKEIHLYEIQKNKFDTFNKFFLICRVCGQIGKLDTKPQPINARRLIWCDGCDNKEYMEEEG